MHELHRKCGQKLERRKQWRALSATMEMPIRPVFLCAMVFGGLVRVLEIYVSVASPLPVLVRIWQNQADRAFSLSDGIRYCVILFLLVALLEVVVKPKVPARWASLVFCMILAYYTSGIDHFTDRLQALMAA